MTKAENYQFHSMNSKLTSFNKIAIKTDTKQTKTKVHETKH